MNVADLLRSESMKSPRLIVQGKDFYAPITGINVLEAPDIDLWGRKGMVLLSSYYALGDLSPADLRAFCSLVEGIGISALVIKVQRLIDKVPELLVEECRNRQITLIEIGKNVNYQDVLLEVFRPVIERSEAQLALHYRLSNISSQLSLSMAGMKEILLKFREFLDLEITLVEEPTGRRYSTASNDRAGLTLGQPLPLRLSEYMNFRYRRYTCSYDDGVSFSDSVLWVDINCIADLEHTLIVHELRDHQVQAEEIVIIENLIRSLQTLILRQQSNRQQQQMNQNALLGDLLAGKIAQQSYRDEALMAVGLRADTKTQVLTIFTSVSALEPDLRAESIVQHITRILRGRFAHSQLYVSPNRLQVVLQDNDLGPSIQSITGLAESINRYLRDEVSAGEIRFVGGLSEIGIAENLHDLEVQSRISARFFRQNGKWSHIGRFDSLGVLKLFTLAEREDLLRFVPNDVLGLYRDEPDLYETLRWYIRLNHSHTAAARQLGIHVKTVRYRINRIEDILQMNLNDPETTSILLVAFEILTFIEGTSNNVDQLIASELVQSE